MAYCASKHLACHVVLGLCAVGGRVDREGLVGCEPDVACVRFLQRGACASPVLSYGQSTGFPYHVLCQLGSAGWLARVVVVCVRFEAASWVS